MFLFSYLLIGSIVVNCNCYQIILTILFTELIRVTYMLTDGYVVAIDFLVLPIYTCFNDHSAVLDHLIGRMGLGLGAADFRRLSLDLRVINFINTRKILK